MTVLGELGGHPGAVDLMLGGVVQDVEPDRTSQEVTHLHIVIRYR